MKWNESEASIGRVLAVEVCTCSGRSLYYIFDLFKFSYTAAKYTHMCVSFLLYGFIYYFFFTGLFQGVRLYLKRTINNIFWRFHLKPIISEGPWLKICIEACFSLFFYVCVRARVSAYTTMPIALF